MKPNLSAALVLAGLIGTAGSTVALAQATSTVAPTATPGPATTPTPAAAPGETSQATAPDGQMTGAGEKADRMAYFDAHIAALHAGLALSPDQEKLWPALDQAIRGVAEMRRDRHQPDVGKEAQDGKGEDAIQTLKQTSQRMVERGQALEALADASAPLYATLSPDQKRRLPVLLRDLAPARGPIGRMMAMLGVDGGDSAPMDDWHKGHGREQAMGGDRDGERGGWGERDRHWRHAGQGRQDWNDDGMGRSWRDRFGGQDDWDQGHSGRDKRFGHYDEGSDGSSSMDRSDAPRSRSSQRDENDEME